MFKKINKKKSLIHSFIHVSYIMPVTGGTGGVIVVFLAPQPSCWLSVHTCASVPFVHSFTCGRPLTQPQAPTHNCSG